MFYLNNLDSVFRNSLYNHYVHHKIKLDANIYIYIHNRLYEKDFSFNNFHCMTGNSKNTDKI